MNAIALVYIVGQYFYMHWLLPVLCQEKSGCRLHRSKKGASKKVPKLEKKTAVT